MIVLHTADLHFDIKDFVTVQKSFEQIIDYVEFNTVDLVVIAGDIFDKAVVLEEASNSPVNPTLDSFIRLADLVPIYIVEGNPPHDKFGSLEILTKLKTTHPIKVVDHCDDTFTVFEAGEFKDYDTSVSLKVIINNHKESDSLLLFGLPWPIKLRFLSNKELQQPLREVNNLYNERVASWIEKRKKLFKSLGNRYGCMLVAHLQLQGAIASTGQELTSIYHTPAMYKGMSHYGALGHIHLAQRDKELYYSGSIRNNNWGELESKQFNVVDYRVTPSGVTTTIKHKLIQTPLLLKIVISGEEELKSIYKIIKSKITKKDNYKVWVSINGIKNKDSVDQNKISRFLENLGGELAKIDVTETIMISQRSRDIRSSVEKTLRDKYMDWCAVNNFTYTKFQIQKLEEAELLIT